MNRRITERIAYKDAGRKLRLSRQRLVESDLRANGRAWRVWAACIELTASYSKNAERTTVVEIAALAGVRKDKASPILREFDRLGVFTWHKDRGRRSPGLLVLPSMGPEAGSLFDPELGPYLEAEGSSTPRRAGQPGKHCRKHPEVEIYAGDCYECEREAYYARHGGA